MARKTGGLGKGLDALLPSGDELPQNTGAGGATFASNGGVPAGDVDGAADGGTAIAANGSAGRVGGVKTGGVVQLAVEKLIPNPGQPRKYFDEAELRELADSITEHGIIQPIIAADAGDGSFIIIAGERRTRAARLAGLSEVPVIIRDYTDQKRLEISLIENIQRTDLNPIEEAAAYKNLMDFSGLSQDDLAARVGKNRSTVANALRLLKLPADMQKSIESGRISPGHARALLSVTNAKAREKLYSEILAGELSVRETEKRAAAAHAGPAAKGADEDKGGEKEKPAAKRAPEIGAMEEKFIGKLGTKVVIEGDLNKGRIHIDYYSMEDLERLYEILGN
ncbi:chromosome partitioning protein ParB [Spirochaetia bacterium]|nr:chromosome partitioning protein ParB [Spirochaetia bacterium]